MKCKCGAKVVYSQGKSLCTVCDNDEVMKIFDNNKPYFINEPDVRLIDASEWINRLGNFVVDLKSEEKPNTKLIGHIETMINDIRCQPTYSGTAEYFSVVEKC